MQCFSYDAKYRSATRVCQTKLTKETGETEPACRQAGSPRIIFLTSDRCFFVAPLQNYSSRISLHVTVVRMVQLSCGSVFPSQSPVPPRSAPQRTFLSLLLRVSRVRHLWRRQSLEYRTQGTPRARGRSPPHQGRGRLWRWHRDPQVHRVRDSRRTPLWDLPSFSIFVHPVLHPQSSDTHHAHCTLGSRVRFVCTEPVSTLQDNNQGAPSDV